jgi:TnpA family transposase
VRRVGGRVHHRRAVATTSDAEPDTIHADTQGQSYPVHALAHLFGFDLLTRIRNWKDLTFYRAAADLLYAHIDQLFGAPGENTINWQLIETHWVDLMQVVLSIRAGRLSSTLLLRRLGTESRQITHSPAEACLADRDAHAVIRMLACRHGSVEIR